MQMSDYRTAGIFLLLTALATAISVPARLMAGADDTPLTDSIAQGVNLDAVEIARHEVSEKLAAIGSAKLPYGIGGAARVAGGLTLAAAGFYLWRTMASYHPSAMAIVAVLLAASGLASAVSGAAAVSLALLAPEPQGTITYAPVANIQGMGWGYGNEQILLSVRWIAGSLGFTLAGLSLVALALAQWRMGGILRVVAGVDAVLGVAMLFIWLDAATFLHRITGIAFLIWLIVVGLWLVIPWLRAMGLSSPAQRR